jgi:MoxR-like ATPase
LSIYVFERTEAGLSAIDDSARTLTLAALNARYAATVGRDERHGNEKFFAWFNPRSEVERRLLKAAKELRLAMRPLARSAASVPGHEERDRPGRG